MTIDSLTRRIDVLLAEIHQRLPEQREAIDLSLLPLDEQTECMAFLKSIEHKVDMASLRPYEHISDDELETLKLWALHLKALDGRAG